MSTHDAKGGSHAEPNHAAIGKALGRISSGLFILSAREGASASAMLVSWVQQAAFNPPAVCVALAKERPLRGVVERSGWFALSVLAQDNSALLKRFARGVPDGSDPFAGLSIITTPAHQNVLADSLAWLDCRLLKIFEYAGDHDLLVAEVTAAAILKEGAPFTHLRGSGFHY